MPIANVLVSKELQARATELADFTLSWSAESELSGKHMTVNFLPGLCQSGAAYDLMAVLYLPTLWSEENVQALQVGLANALAKRLDVRPDRVHVMTTIIQSGRVVEDGRTQS